MFRCSCSRSLLLEAQGHQVCKHHLNIPVGRKGRGRGGEGRGTGRGGEGGEGGLLVVESGILLHTHGVRGVIRVDDKCILGGQANLNICMYILCL